MTTPEGARAEALASQIVADWVKSWPLESTSADAWTMNLDRLKHAIAAALQAHRGGEP